MSSSSTEPGAEVVAQAPRGFLSVDRGGLVRLAVALAFGVAALLSPSIGSTSAHFTDNPQVAITFVVTPTPTPTATPAPAPSQPS
ncbi:hypothetical protein [Cellulomonas fengjieae]|uniref:hypothetical protein n=1 Tax=Cellulomonas fengjieae TaxID=2819978 RepID=UPI001AAF20A7|nr:hypothetical protein [Cellulomonas fengjieae]MBO3101862.1 hypothetical protein [Cellulomonas fengjieae]